MATVTLTIADCDDPPGDHVVAQTFTVQLDFEPAPPTVDGEIAWDDATLAQKSAAAAVMWISKEAEKSGGGYVSASDLEALPSTDDGPATAKVRVDDLLTIVRIVRSLSTLASRAQRGGDDVPPLDPDAGPALQRIGLALQDARG